MLLNLDAAAGLSYSQRVLLALVDAGHDREDATRSSMSAACGRERARAAFAPTLEADPAVRERLAEIATFSILSTISEHRRRVRPA